MKNGKLFWVCCAVVAAFVVFQLIGGRIPEYYDSPGQALRVSFVHLGRVITEVLAPFAAVGIIATAKRSHSV
jgi:hypothetical protein